jgi:predicted aspartyl protease
VSVTFNYAAEMPPAPYVLVTVARPDGATSAADLPAKVDSGAARTVIPMTVVEHLKLEAVDQQKFEGLGGVQVTLSIFRLLLTIRGCTTLEVNAAGSDGEPYILLGRDVLNQFRVVLDGPKGKLEIG